MPKVRGRNPRPDARPEVPTSADIRGEAMAGRTLSTSYTATKLTVEADMTFTDLESRLEEAVPYLPFGQLAEMVTRLGSWDAVVDFTNKTAPHGFLHYLKNPAGRV